MSHRGCRELIEDAGLAGDCCNSCHEDEDHGFPLLWVAFKNQDYEVCCRVLLALEVRNHCGLFEVDDCPRGGGAS
jgi:hypothetical protein